MQGDAISTTAWQSLPPGSSPDASIARLPQAEATPEGVVVVAEPGARRKLLEQLGVAATEHDVVGFERGFELLDDVRHVATPLLLAQALQPAEPDIILVGAPFLVRQVRQFHGLEDTVHD